MRTRLLELTVVAQAAEPLRLRERVDRYPALADGDQGLAARNCRLGMSRLKTHFVNGQIGKFAGLLAGRFTPQVFEGAQSFLLADLPRDNARAHKAAPPLR